MNGIMFFIFIIVVMYLLVVILAIDLYKKIFTNRKPVLIILYSLFWPVTGAVSGVIFFIILIFEVVSAIWSSLKGRSLFR